MLSLVFGLIGMAMVNSGKKTQRTACLTAGLALMTAPCLAPGHLAMPIVGSALIATPAVWKA